MKVKVHYDLLTGSVKGYYPESINYSSIPEPVIEIDVGEQINNKQMCVLDGVYQEYTSPTYFADLKNSKVLSIKSQAKKIIHTTYPDYKQRNLTGAVSRIQNKEILALKAGGANYTPTAEELLELTAANDCELFIKATKAKSNELEASLDNMTQEQLEAFDPSDNLNWE